MQEIRYSDVLKRRDDEVTAVRNIQQVERAMVRVGTRKIVLHPPGSRFDAWHNGKRFKYRVDDAGNLWQVVPGPERMIAEAP